MNSFTRTPLKSDGNAIWMRGSVVVLNGLVFLGFVLMALLWFG